MIPDSRLRPTGHIPPLDDPLHPCLDSIDILVDCPQWRNIALVEEVCRVAILSTLKAETKATHSAISVFLSDDDSMADLNERYRGRPGPTNILSFSGPEPGFRNGDTSSPYLGDIALAWETVFSEARQQGKSRRDHLSHLVIHGVLHLLGYNHTHSHDATRMENRERKIMAGLGIPDPY